MATGPVSLGVAWALLYFSSLVSLFFSFHLFHLSLVLHPEFAMSPNNNEVHIYFKKGAKWEVEHVLKEVGPCKLFSLFDFFF